MRTTTVRTGGWASGIQSARSGELLVPAARPSFVSLMLVNLARLVARVLRGACRHPVGVTLALGGLYALHVGGPRLLALVLVVASVALAGWRRTHEASFRRFVGSAYRSAAVYGRRWQPAMVACGLSVNLDGVEYLPRVV